MNFFKKASAVALGTVAAAPAFAAGVDLSPLTSSIDAGSVITAILAVGGVLGAIAVVIMGVRKVVGFIR